MLDGIRTEFILAANHFLGSPSDPARRARLQRAVDRLDRDGAEPHFDQLIVACRRAVDAPASHIGLVQAGMREALRAYP